MSAQPTWLCPTCFKRLPYGKTCDAPGGLLECPEPKNVNADFYMRMLRECEKRDEAPGVGISEIAKGDEE